MELVLSCPISKSLASKGMVGNHLHGNDNEVALPEAGIVASSERRQRSGERRKWLASPPSLLPVAQGSSVSAPGIARVLLSGPGALYR
jgi:hypothetical protein